MADRYFHDGPLSAGPLTLTGPEAHHLGRVLRAAAGTEVIVFNGTGAEYHAVVVSVARGAVDLEITRVQHPRRESGRRVVAGVAVPKGDRGDFLVEKLVELGVTAFIPLATRRSVVKPGDGRTDRFRRAVVEASKQCGRNVLMAVSGACPWEKFIRRDDLPDVRRIADFGGETWTDVETDVAFAVGPEGGFTEDEVAGAVALGWKRVGLGPRVLRVETAAVALAALLSIRQ